MYDVESFMMPEGYTYVGYVNELLSYIKADMDKEHNMEILFRMTYPIAIRELKKYSNVDYIEELLPDMSIAFMTSIRLFDPANEKASFMNYYKLAIRTQIISTRYKHRNDKEKKELYKDYEKDKLSIDMPIPDTDDDLSFIDTVEDTNVDIEDTIIGRDLEDKIYEVIDTMFKHQKTKDIFTDYINNHITEAEEPLSVIAEKYGTSASYVSSLVLRYKPRLRAELRKRGY